MKILFSIDCLTAGGKERRLIELIKFLKLRDDIEIELIVMRKDVHYKEVFELGIKMHYLIRKTKKDFSVFNKFYKICKSFRPDVVHSWDSMTTVYAVPACRILNIKFINGIIVNAPQKNKLFDNNWIRAKLTFPFSNIIIGNSKAGMAAYGAPKYKSHFIHNGFNFERIADIKEKEIILSELKIDTKYLVGMVATFSEYKDYRTYFDAAQLLLSKRNDITFLAIGNKTDSASAKALVDNKYEKHFRFLGMRSDVESLVSAMDICILSTFSEGISNSILEYMALAKPVIATTGGGTTEIVDDKKTGFLIGPSNPAELAAKTEILLNDEKLRKQMGLAGHERIRNCFSIEKMVDKYIAICEDSLSKNKTKQH